MCMHRQCIRFVIMPIKWQLPHAIWGVCIFRMGTHEAYSLMCTCRPGQVLMQPPAMQDAQQPVHAFLGHRAQQEGTPGNTDTIDSADGRSPAQTMIACRILGQRHSRHSKSGSSDDLKCGMTWSAKLLHFQ